MQKIITTTLLIVCCALLTLAQTPDGKESFKGFIVGQVTERSSGQPIAGARVSVENKSEATSDAEGRFLLPIESGFYDVRFEATGFAPTIKNQIGVTGKRNTPLDAQLDIAISANVEVKSEVFAENTEQNVSNTTLNREEIRQTPGSGGDSLRVINSQPAVSAVSTEFADLIVRGGSTEENLGSGSFTMLNNSWIQQTYTPATQSALSSRRLHHLTESQSLLLCA